MNEEIFKHLQDQCRIYNTHPDMIDTDGNGENRPCGFDTKKFALLIVEECRYVMDCNKGSDQHTEWNQALFETSKKIKEHFGVE